MSAESVKEVIRKRKETEGGEAAGSHPADFT